LFCFPPPAGGTALVGNNLADNLLFTNNDVYEANSGYLDNSGLLLSATGGTYVNVFTGKINGIYVGEAGLPYWITVNGSEFGSTYSADLTVPEYGSFSMLILCAMALAGTFLYKGKQSGMFLNS
jgi:hypothetical protein